MTKQKLSVKPLITRSAIDKRVQEMGEEISQAYQGVDELIVICALKGAVMFMSDLVRHITLPLSIDFIQVSSYGDSTESSGVVRLDKGVGCDIKNKDVLLVEDIIDTGASLAYMTKYLNGLEPRSLKTCLFLDNPHRRTVPMEPDFLGFIIPNEFVIGYGLDYKQQYRNLPYVGIKIAL